MSSSSRQTARSSSSSALPSEETAPPTRQERNIQLAQETIYRFLLDAVRKWPAEEVLLEFKRLFFYHLDSTSSGSIHAIYEIVFSNDEAEFRNTLKRCCYILVNNWDATRNYKPIQELVQQFEVAVPEQNTISPTLKRLRAWVSNFKHSKDYEELKLFTARYEQQQGPWSSRYTSYLLVPQFVDLSNPAEQREAARALAKHLKDRFKFDLAMYVAKSQSATSVEQFPKNPTMLGDDVLRLIKTIVAKRGRFSYANLANIFVQQVEALSYREFKHCLRKYLVFSVESSELAATLQTRLSEKLEGLYLDYESNPLSDALMLRTCNRMIEYLTIENRQEPEPSQLFALLLSKGNPMTLVVVLLKIILICKHSRTHLEAKIADLIRYYENYPEDECSWIVNFLEIFNVTFAIHAENVQYNLIKMDEVESMANLDDYRIFSQMKQLSPLELTRSAAAEEAAISAQDIAADPN
jgi:hypothetical protein